MADFTAISLGHLIQPNAAARAGAVDDVARSQTAFFIIGPGPAGVAMQSVSVPKNLAGG
jgi:hypothetical protein